VRLGGEAEIEVAGSGNPILLVAGVAVGSD
jgi:hypothetical protein